MSPDVLNPDATEYLPIVQRVEMQNGVQTQWISDEGWVGTAYFPADLNDSGEPRYRSVLIKRWAESGPCVGWIMLNPSTADAKTLDPTLRRCESFSREWGFGAMAVTNLFQYRSTNPKALRRVGRQALGPEPNKWFKTLLEQCPLTIAGWGHDGDLFGRGKEVARWWRANSRLDLMCLGTNNDGTPKHPLYLPKVTKPVPYKPDLTTDLNERRGWKTEDLRLTGHNFGAAKYEERELAWVMRCRNCPAFMVKTPTGEPLWWLNTGR